MWNHKVGAGSRAVGAGTVPAHCLQAVHGAPGLSHLGPDLWGAFGLCLLERKGRSVLFRFLFLWVPCPKWLHPS